MRFQLVDKILRFDKNKSIVGVKGVSLEANDLVPFPQGSLVYPVTLCLESLAQLGGWLTTASLDFVCLPVLGIISQAEVYKEARVGDNLLVKAELIDLSDEASVIKGEIRRDEVLIIKVKRVVYGLVKIEDKRFIEGQKRMFQLLLKDGLMDD